MGNSTTKYGGGSNKPAGIGGASGKIINGTMPSSSGGKPYMAPKNTSAKYGSSGDGSRDYPKGTTEND